MGNAIASHHAQYRKPRDADLALGIGTEGTVGLRESSDQEATTAKTHKGGLKSHATPRGWNAFLHTPTP